MDQRMPDVLVLLKHFRVKQILIDILYICRFSEFKLIDYIILFDVLQFFQL